jgi:hypothetical protein
MSMREALEMRGQLTLQRRNAARALVETRTIPNNIVLSGRDLVANMFIGTEGVQPISHVAVGTGASEENPLQRVALERQVFHKPIEPIDPSSDLQDVLVNDQPRRKLTIRALLDFAEPDPAANEHQPYALTEAGLFTANNVMYNRVVFAPVNKTGDFQLTLIWEILF